MLNGFTILLLFQLAGELISRGLELINEMRRALPGYAVPRFVQEVAGEFHKRVLA